MREWRGCLLALLTMTGLGTAAAAAPLKPCRIDGIPNELQCGSLQRPLDPARPDGAKIDVHYLVVPAMARNKQPDAVLMLAGGPGQSAIQLAARMQPRLSRLGNRRDIVFIDQRGTGQSAPLLCPDDSKLPLTEQLDTAAQLRRLGRLPRGAGEAALRGPALLHDDDRDAGHGRRARSAGRAAVEPHRRQLRHARRAGVPAPVPQQGPPHRHRRRGAARHGAARQLLARHAGRAGQAARRARQDPPDAARRLAGAAGLAATPRDGGPAADGPARALHARPRAAAARRAPTAVPAGAGRRAARRHPGRCARGPLRRPVRPDLGLRRRQGHAAGDGHALLGRLRRGHAAPDRVDRPARRGLPARGRRPVRPGCARPGPAATCRPTSTKCRPRPAPCSS